MDDALLVCVLHPLAHVDEQRQPIADREPMLVAVLRDGNPLHVLHREVRAALGRRPRVVDARDVRMIHQSQGLSLGIEASQDFLGVHAPLDQLERDRPANGHVLLRLVDDAHAAFADFPQDAVGTDAPRAVTAGRRRRLGKGRAVAVVRAVFGHSASSRAIRPGRWPRNSLGDGPPLARGIGEGDKEGELPAGFRRTAGAFYRSRASQTTRGQPSVSDSVLRISGCLAAYQDTSIDM